MSTKLVMRRNGNFQCHWAHADGKCGADTNLSPKYFYECEIVAIPSLDQHDFLIDQLDIDKYFQTRYTPIDDYETTYKSVPKSCERIALNAITDISVLLNRHFQANHGSSMERIVTRLRVSIGFNSQAVMTAEWTPEQKKNANDPV